MPKFVHVTNEEVSAIAEEGSCSKETVQRRNCAMKSFTEFAASMEPPLDTDDLVNKAKEDQRTHKINHRATFISYLQHLNDIRH